MKKFLMPCGLCAAVPALKTVPPSKDSPTPVSNDKQDKKLMRPSELPIYIVEEPCSVPRPCADDSPPSFLEEGFGTVRKGVQGLWSEYSSITEGFNTKVSTGYEHSLLMLDYLREESNMMPRLGAVGIGGLTGLIFSLRGGKFKRLVYTSTGALSVAAVCYPKQAQESVTMVKHYANIGYNFVYGVKPGDSNQLELKLPEMPKMKIPSSTSEFFDLAVDAGSSLASLVGSLAGKASEAIIGDQETKSPQVETKPKQN